LSAGGNESWTAGGSIPIAKANLGSAGLQTAALAFGGAVAVVLASTESYDGTSWTANGNLNIARNVLAGAGTQTSALAAGGSPNPAFTATEEFTGGPINVNRTISFS
jgi:hypothetical protein